MDAFILKLRELTWIISIFSLKRTHQTIQQNTIKCIKVQSRSGTKWTIKDLQNKLNEFVLLKKLEEAALHKHYGIRQSKRLSADKFKIK